MLKYEKLKTSPKNKTNLNLVGKMLLNLGTNLSN